jgi:alanyl-tRNA synthetase
MTSKEIRQSFIDFFKQKEHTFVPSAPVVPIDDPTLLFTNAGMNQFKDILLGKSKQPYQRAVNSQKCIRVSGKHNDLEEVGHDTYHHTFFEMLGNWSFGDYYKKEAITWAWELLTEVWKIPKDKLYATVFRDDDESAELWAKVTDLKKERILRFDEKDNFWEMGETGPCGPCSEIHIDLGKDFCDKKNSAHHCGVNGDCARYIELWNLVFIQYNRDEAGSLHPLPSKHVDTGAGFERLVAVLQGKRSNYATDIFTPLLDKIAELTHSPYEMSDKQAAYHVIADHVRMLTFSIADGALPGNEGRGYVMRRILRRAARYGRNLNMHQPFIYRLVPTVMDVLGDSFPISRERMDHVSVIIQAEEEHFNRTLDRGLEIFEKIKSDLMVQKQNIIPGKDVFKLYDTYGFPVDLTRILADEADLKLDDIGFESEMKIQRDRARKAAKFQSTDIPEDSWITLTESSGTNFVGYTEDTIETHIVKYSLHKNKLHIVLKDTPFYAESGGQISDRGIIVLEGNELEVIDVQKDGDEVIHICRLPKDFTINSDRVFAELHTDDRRQTEKNHTATHLLHAALRKVLGSHVQQAGSLVEPGRLRFDFTHFARINPKQITEIERLVNEKIQDDRPLAITEDSFESAKKKGAIALFGEKYGKTVRTVEVLDFSLELCGGTHVKRTGQIGPFIITYEGSIASGVRRIEALTGREAVRYLQKSRDQMKQLSELLNTGENEITDKISELVETKRKIEKELEKVKTDNLSQGMGDILKTAETIHGINVISYTVENSTMDQLKEVGDQIRGKSKNTVALLGSTHAGKIIFVCVVTDDLIKEKGLKAGDLVQKVAGITGGGGGGRPHMATAGGKDITKFETAMAHIKNII